MPDRLPVICTVDLHRLKDGELDCFTAKLVLPIDMTPAEADYIAVIVDQQAIDPSEGAKFAVSDPTIAPEVTL
jgi:hypothetical protein